MAEVSRESDGEKSKSGRGRFSGRMIIPAAMIKRAVNTQSQGLLNTVSCAGIHV